MKINSLRKLGKVRK